MMVHALLSEIFFGARRRLGVRAFVVAAVIVGTLVCPVGLWASNDLVLAGHICNDALTPSSAEAAGARRPRSSTIGDYANLDHLPQATRAAIANRFQHLVGSAQQLEAVVGAAGQPGGVFDLQIDFADLALRAQLDVLRGQAESRLRPGERLSAQQLEVMLSQIDASGHVGTLEWMRGVYERRLIELNGILAYFRDRCAAEIAAETLSPPIDSTTGAPVLLHRDRLEDSAVRRRMITTFLPLFTSEAELRRAVVAESLRIVQVALGTFSAQRRLSLAQLGSLALDYPHTMGSLEFNLEGHLGELETDLVTTRFRLGDMLERLESGQRARGPLDPRGLFFENRFLGVPTPRSFSPLGLVASVAFGLGPLGLIEVPAWVDNSRYVPSAFTNHDGDHLSLLSPYQSEGVEHRAAFFGRYLHFLRALEQQGESTQVDLLILLFFDAARERGLGPITRASDFKTALLQVLSPNGRSLQTSLAIAREILTSRLQARLVPNDFLASLRAPIANGAINREVTAAVNAFLEWLEAEVQREQNAQR